ncbi:MAG: hypothetical protein IJ343_07155 [Clostridia bacterium]|nr:hypothetical protein [Clostridia bacterium]
MLCALIISVAVLVVLGALVLLLCRKSARLKLMLLTLVAMLAVMCIRVPLYLQGGGEGRAMDMPAAVVQGFAHALQAVTLAEDMDGPVEEGSALLEEEKHPLAVDFYRIYSVALSILAPVLGGALLLEALAAFFPYLRLRLPGWRPVFVFSRVNPQAVTLAGSILEDIPARIVFQQTATAQEEASEALVQRVKDMGAICLNGEASLRQLSGWIRSVTYVFIDPNEQENIKDLARRLAEAPEKGWIRRKRCVRCYAFAQSREAEKTIDALAERHVGRANQIVCMLNVQENVAQHILEHHPLHEYAAEGPEGTKELRVLVVGSDAQAEHFFANAYVCGQMHDTRLTVTVTAPDAESFARRLHANAPMLECPEHPAVRMCGEVRCATMEDEVSPALLGRADYILVSLGSDAQNVEMAAKIRLAIDRQKLLDPERAMQRVVVLFMQEDDALHELYQKEFKPNRLPQGQGCELIPVGSRRQQYSAQVLLSEERMFRGFFVHRAYAGQTQMVSREALMQDYIRLMNNAYNRRSSVSAAMQLDYRQHFRQHTALSPEQADAALAQVEHQRWTAYTILDGYRAPTEEELQLYAFKPGFKHKLDALMLHPCLVESRCAPEGELWEEREPADALDGLSLRLHEMALDELEALMGKSQLAAVRRPQSRVSAELEKGMLRLYADTFLAEEKRERARLLIDNLFRDYKQVDREIVQQTDWIIRSARQYAPLLRSFWK